MSRAAWLESRRAGLGGSDVGQLPEVVAACGGDPETDCAPWASPWSVWASKVYGPEDRQPTAAMQTGNLLEPVVLDWACRELRAERLPTPPMARRYPLIGNIDGVCRVPSGVVVGLEAKVDGGWQLWERVPFYYVLQVRTYMHLFDLPAMWVCVFHRHLPAWSAHLVKRDADIEHALVTSARQWWERHVMLGEPPEIDDSKACAAGLARHHPRTRGASVADFRVATPGEVQLARDVVHFEGLFRDAERDRGEARNLLRAAIGDDAGIRWTGGSARWSSNNRLIIKEDER